MVSLQYLIHKQGLEGFLTHEIGLNHIYKTQCMHRVWSPVKVQTTNYYGGENRPSDVRFCSDVSRWFIRFGSSSAYFPACRFEFCSNSVWFASLSDCVYVTGTEVWGRTTVPQYLAKNNVSVSIVCTSRPVCVAKFYSKLMCSEFFCNRTLFKPSTVMHSLNVL